MKKQPLNYEAIFYTYDGKEIDRFDFHGQSPALASDHALQCLFANNIGADVIHYRKKGAVKWKEFRKMYKV